MSGARIGERLARIEDPALLKGRGKFVGDIVLPRMLEAAFVRSPHPHALVRSIDAGAALALPGVHHVLTYDDFAPVLASNHIPYDHKTWQFTEHCKPIVIPKEEVCFAGEAVAMNIAGSVPTVPMTIDGRYEGEFRVDVGNRVSGVRNHTD